MLKLTLPKLSRLLLVSSLFLATGFGSSTCVWTSGEHDDDVCLQIQTPSNSGAFTTNATTVVITGYVSGWDGWDDTHDVVWANDTTVASGTAFSDDHYFQTPAIALVLGSNSIRVRTSGTYHGSAQRGIVVTRTP
jgi:hypothetical protein